MSSVVYSVIQYVIFWPDYKLKKLLLTNLPKLKISLFAKTHPDGSKGLSRRLGNKTRLKTLEGRCISQKQLTIIGTIQGRGMGALQQADLRRRLLTWYCPLRRRGPFWWGGGRAAHPALRCCRLLGPVTFTVPDFTPHPCRHP